MDRITLSSIRAYGRHGVDPRERAHVQAFEIVIALDVDLAGPARTDDLSQTVDYAALHRRVVEIVETTSYALLERLASDLIGMVFSNPRVTYAEVSVAKPGILEGATPTVTLRRANPQAASP